jgi:hypothetical protein
MYNNLVVKPAEGKDMPTNTEFNIKSSLKDQIRFDGSVEI